MTGTVQDPGLWTCPVCGRSTPNANDIAAGYCGECCWWTGKPDLLAERADLVAVAEDRQLCPSCREPVDPADQVTAIPETRPGKAPGMVIRTWHSECLALGIVGHQFGVCSCHGFDTSRAAARELSARMDRKRMDKGPGDLVGPDTTEEAPQ